MTAIPSGIQARHSTGEFDYRLPVGRIVAGIAGLLLLGTACAAVAGADTGAIRVAGTVLAPASARVVLWGIVAVCFAGSIAAGFALLPGLHAASRLIVQETWIEFPVGPLGTPIRLDARQVTHVDVWHVGHDSVIRLHTLSRSYNLHTSRISTEAAGTVFGWIDRHFHC
jgi:hypothetical protein